jgi:hypothetical protein
MPVTISKITKKGFFQKERFELEYLQCERQYSVKDFMKLVE